MHSLDSTSLSKFIMMICPLAHSMQPVVSTPDDIEAKQARTNLYNMNMYGLKALGRTPTDGACCVHAAVSQCHRNPIKNPATCNRAHCVQLSAIITKKINPKTFTTASIMKITELSNKTLSHLAFIKLRKLVASRLTLLNAWIGGAISNEIRTLDGERQMADDGDDGWSKFHGKLSVQGDVNHLLPWKRQPPGKVLRITVVPIGQCLLTKN